MAIYRGPGGSGDATDDAASQAALVVQKVAEANILAAQAAASASSAATSAAVSSAAASSTAGSVAAAAGSASNAATSASDASDSATAAAAEADLANDAADSATASASAASTSASNASNSATSASNSASAASTSASNAASSASSASSSASSATSSASNAAISESNAASSASSASTSASNASTSASNAASSASSAASSASDAASSASAASGSATGAASSAADALTYKNAAATSATNAATSATNSANSATASANSATASAASASSAASVYDAFDDRYLGAKSTEPTVDNDGNALLQGALYFNTVYDIMKVWSGTEWVTVTTAFSEASPLVSGTMYGETEANAYAESYTVNSIYSTFSAIQTLSRVVFNTAGTGKANNIYVINAYTEGHIVVGQVLELKLKSPYGTEGMPYYWVTVGTITQLEYIPGTYPYLAIHLSGMVSLGDNDYLLETLTVSTSPNGENTVLGYNSLANLDTGAKNTVIGYQAGGSIETGLNNIVIGDRADASGDVSNEVTLGNTSITKTRLRGAILVGNSTPSAGSAGDVLTSNGSGSAPSWTALSGTYQPLDADLTAIAALAGTSGLLKKTAANTWSLDTSTYLTSETDPVYVASSWYSTTNNATNWNTAYSDRMKWDGGATGLDAATGRTSLGLGTAATTNSTAYATAAQGTNADTAYGWGNHASAGYLTTSTAASTYAPLTGTGASGTWGISISGNAATVTNGLYSTGSYSNPSWLTTLAGSKITGTIDGGTY